MNAHPEHALQVRIHSWVRECVAAPHSFMSSDRSKAHSQFQHAREAARGIRKGTPDTLLLVSGKALFCELKAPGNRPTEHQDALGREIIDAGSVWFWADSVDGYRQHLLQHGVPLSPSAAMLAARADAMLAALATKPIVKRSTRARQARPSASRIARVHAARSRLLF